MGEIMEPPLHWSWGYVVIQESSWCWYCCTLLTSQESRWHPALTMSSFCDEQMCLEREGYGDDKIESHYKGYSPKETIVWIDMSNAYIRRKSRYIFNRIFDTVGGT